MKSVTARTRQPQIIRGGTSMRASKDSGEHTLSYRSIAHDQVETDNCSDAQRTPAATSVPDGSKQPTWYPSAPPFELPRYAHLVFLLSCFYTRIAISPFAVSYMQHGKRGNYSGHGARHGGRMRGGRAVKISSRLPLRLPLPLPRNLAVRKVNR